MPIRHLLEQSAFGPEEVRAITEAFDRLCTKMGLLDRSDPLVETVATAVMMIAETGVKDTAHIEQQAFARLRGI